MNKNFSFKDAQSIADKEMNDSPSIRSVYNKIRSFDSVDSGQKSEMAQKLLHKKVNILQEMDKCNEMTLTRTFGEFQ